MAPLDSQLEDGGLSSRVESIVRGLIRGARGTGWAVGVFDSDGDLVEFARSGPQVDRRNALEALCTIPLPDAPEVITLKVTGEDGKIADRLGGAALVGYGRSLVIVVFRPRSAAEKAWARIGRGIQAAVRRIAQVVAADTASIVTRPHEMPSALNSHPAFFILTPDLNIALQWSPPGTGAGNLAELVAPNADRLPTILERAVRRLTVSWDFSRLETCTAATAYAIPGLALRVAPMHGAGVVIGVFLEPHVRHDPIDRAAAAFRLSEREREVLRALLDGHSITDIALMLNLSESTINDHIARLIVKTNARNRIQMAATLLGWSAARTSDVPSSRRTDD